MKTPKNQTANFYLFLPFYQLISVFPKFPSFPFLPPQRHNNQVWLPSLNEQIQIERAEARVNMSDRLLFSSPDSIYNIPCLCEPGHEILVLILHNLNMHVQLSSGVRGLHIGKSLHHCNYFVCVSSQCSDKTPLMHRLVPAFTVHIRNKSKISRTG